MSEINEMTWEELHPDWPDETDLTHYFEKSQFAGCPGCGKVEQLRIFNASQDDSGANVICEPCGFVAWGDSPSQALKRWNTRIDAERAREAAALIQEGMDSTGSSTSHYHKMDAALAALQRR